MPNTFKLRRPLFGTLLVLVSLPVFAEVTDAISYKMYKAEHKAGESLLRALNRASPIRQSGEIFHAYTAWNVRWRFWWNLGENGLCSFTRVETSLSAEITLPELVSAEPQTKLEFSRYIASLRFHELGHVKIAQAVANKIDAGIASISPMSSCALLEKTANQLGERLLEEARAEERNYDLTTQYGRTQGAWLQR